MPNTLDCYNYLWDGSAPGWVLLKAPELAGGYCIFNELNSTLLHIDDEELNLRLCQRLKEKGHKMIDTIPRIGPLSVDPRDD